MKILYIGTRFGNAFLQYKVLKKVYKNVDFIDGYESFLKYNILQKIFIHISPLYFENYLNNFIIKKIKDDYDLIYIRSGELIGKKLIFHLKKKAKKVVFFCNDNPFAKRDKYKWELFKKAAKFYDLIVFQDKSRIISAKKYNLKNTLLMYPPYDNFVHKRNSNISNKKKFDVVFVGTWSPKKSLLIQKLIKYGLNIRVFGTRWEKDENFEILRPYLQLGHLFNFKYSDIISRAKIALCLFSEENNDTITARSMEIPAIGTFMMSYYTPAMKNIFKENNEVVFFKNSKECFNKCNYYLKNTRKLNLIAKNGHYKVTKVLKNTNHEFLNKIIKYLYK